MTESSIVTEWNEFVAQSFNESKNMDQCEEFSKFMDEKDNLKAFKEKFCFQQVHGSPVRYFCGNSLGLQPKNLKTEVNKQLDKWADEGVEGHFTEPTPWVSIDNIVQESMSRIVGALPSEVVMMNSLTVNLHLMMSAFYRPTETRHKILIEKNAFPSDIYAVKSQIIHHGFDPTTSLLEIAPREGEECINEDDLDRLLLSEGSSIALVLFSGIQYYTGQFFDLPRLISQAHAQGALVGLDLAHAVGNVPLSLHEWGCDFACWCSYKYLNCGPGSIGGCFVHEKHCTPPPSPLSSSSSPSSPDPFSSSLLSPPRLCGWWGHRLSDRFTMGPDFHPESGAYSFRLSNPPVLLIACVRASLDIFEEAGGMSSLRYKSLLLTGYLERLLVESGLSSPPSSSSSSSPSSSSSSSPSSSSSSTTTTTHTVAEGKNILEEEVEATPCMYPVRIFTPRDPTRRGCQLSLAFSDSVSIDSILHSLQSQGIVCDLRRPNVLRVAPTPLYNSYHDVYCFVQGLKQTIFSI